MNPQYTTAQFDWDKTNQCFTAEISELKGSAPQRFTLKSTRTGQVIVFTLSYTNRDHERDDVVCWEYQCHSHQFRAVIFND